MQRAMAVEAEASREARAKVIRVLTKSMAIYTWLLSVFTNISARFNEKCCRGRDRMAVGFTTTYTFCAYHYYSCEFESRSWRGVLDTTSRDKVFSGLQQSDGFLWVVRFPPPIKLTITI